jgi:tetratricopeptide (TPR) repeat protein
LVLTHISKFLFPLFLASRYFDAYDKFSVAHVLLPLLIDALFVVLLVFGGRIIEKQARSSYKAYWFFGLWAALGMIPNLQLIALDATATTPWLYITAAGLLGMAGVFLTAVWRRLNPRAVVTVFVVIIVLFGIRTSIRGLDWVDRFTLARVDIAHSSNNYYAYSDLAAQAMSQKDYKQTVAYAQKSIEAYPTATAYVTKAEAQIYLHDCAGARESNNNAMKKKSGNLNYDLESFLTLCSGDPTTNINELKDALKTYPSNVNLWLALGVAEQRNHDNDAAKTDIATASGLGQVPPAIYNGIMNNQPFTFTIPDVDLTVEVP